MNYFDFNCSGDFLPNFIGFLLLGLVQWFL